MGRRRSGRHRRGRVAAFGTRDAGAPERVVIVVEPSGTVPADVLTDAIRRRIGDLCGLFIHDVVLVPAAMVAARRAVRCGVPRPSSGTNEATSKWRPEARLELQA